jgi:K+-transporting ATPase ATPase A chain
MSLIGRLAVAVVGDISQLQQAFGEAKKEAGSLKKEVDKTGISMESVGKSMTIFGMAIVGAMSAMVLSTAEAADEIDDLAKRTGISRENLQALSYAAEQNGNPALTNLGVDQTPSTTNPGGNMEGKEVRFGIANSVLWETATTAASNGSVNSMHDSYTPLGGLAALWMMMLGEVSFGGVGSGLYGMFVFVIVAVFVAGLMVGRTPEYLGKKIESYEMKMASLLILIMPITVLVLTAIAVLSTPGRATILNPGPHGFSEVLYLFTSQGNNNGSAFAGIGGNNPFYNLTGGIAMLVGRFFLAIPTLALAGSLVKKKKTPSSSGTLPTHTPLFIAWLIAVVILVGALNFFPALALGPVVEHLMLW